MPVRFCAECGAKAVSGAKYCTQCGTALGTAAGTGSGTWQLTVAGGGTLAVFLAAGLTVWAFILTPSAPSPGPGGRPPAAPGSAAIASATRPPDGHPKAELPAEVKTFITD